PQAVSVDQAEVQATATLIGTGSLEGLPVTFSVAGLSVPSTIATSFYDGSAIATIKGLTIPGVITITASVINPASGLTLTDSQPLTITPGSGDSEPNNSVETASPLALNRTIGGTLDGTVDPSDMYRVDASADGVLSVALTLDPNTAPSDVVVVVRDANGNEVSR